MVYDTSHSQVFIFTKVGAVKFSSKVSLTSINSGGFVRQDEFKTRKMIEHVHYNEYHEAIFVAAGLEGIDIYEVVKGGLKFLKNIQGKDLNINYPLNVKDVNSDMSKHYLFVLDYEKGIIVLDIRDLNHIVKLLLQYILFVSYTYILLICRLYISTQ